MRRLLTLLFVAVSLAACGDSGPTDPIPGTTFAPSLGVDLSTFIKTRSGLYYKNTVTGTGATAEPGSIVQVHYTGWLPDGTKFDSSHDTGQPITVTLGSHQVIDGWEEGVPGMQPGGKRLLVVPPSLGYGDTAHGSIPANSVLVFQIELVAVQ